MGSSGEDLTVELVERLGKASALWSGRGRVFVGRDTRASGPELEEAFARGVVAAGGNAVLAGVLPTPAVALLALDLGVVITASHNPPEYNGVKFFDGDGHKLTDDSEGRSRRCWTLPSPAAARSTASTSPPTATSSTSSSASAPTLGGCRIAVDCANGAYSGDRAGGVRSARRRGGRDRRPSPTGRTSTRAAARPTWRARAGRSSSPGSTSGSRSTATATGCSPSTRAGEVVDGDQILAVLALTSGSRSWP